MKKLLVIAYYYPPMIRVGGRRWFLFVKYLRRQGVQVSVLTFADVSEPPVRDSNDLIYVRGERLAHLPYFKKKLPANLLEKIFWKCSYYTYLVWRDFIGYDLNDHSYGVVDDFYSKARTVVARGFDTVVLTVGPFSYSSILADLKRDFPQVNFILDYRDDRFRDKEPLSRRQHIGELKSERKALDAADLILTVDQNIASILAETHPGLSTPIQVLPHGYDEDDFHDIAGISRSSNDQKVKMLYGGACYKGVAEFYALLVQFIELNKSQIDSADMYFTLLTEEVRNILNKSDFVHLKSPITRQEMLKTQTLASDINLVVYPKTNFDARSSKFYELIRCGRPILYFGPEGPTAKFIRENNLGETITCLEEVRKLDLVELRSRPLGTINLHKNSISGLTERLRSLTESMTA